MHSYLCMLFCEISWFKKFWLYNFIFTLMRKLIVFTFEEKRVIYSHIFMGITRVSFGSFSYLRDWSFNIKYYWHQELRYYKISKWLQVDRLDANIWLRKFHLNIGEKVCENENLYNTCLFTSRRIWYLEVCFFS